MPVICNACGSAIDANDINVQADTALCRQCGTATPYSALVHAPTTSMYTAPPAGCHAEIVDGRWRAVASTRGWRAVASTRGWRAVPACFFAVIWNGFVLVFVGIMATITHGWGLLALPLLAGHIWVGLWVAWQACCLAMGDVEVAIDDGQVRIGAGVGTLRRWRRRSIAEIRGVRVDTQPSRWRQFGNQAGCLMLESPKPLRFGHLLSEERRQFLHAVVAAELMRRGKPPGNGSATR